MSLNEGRQNDRKNDDVATMLLSYIILLDFIVSVSTNAYVKERDYRRI